MKKLFCYKSNRNTSMLYLSNFYICKRMRKHSGQSQTDTQTQNTNADTPESVNTHIRIHTVRATKQQTHKNTNTEIIICARAKRVQVLTHGLEGCICMLWNVGRRKLGEVGHGRAQGGHIVVHT